MCELRRQLRSYSSHWTAESRRRTQLRGIELSEEKVAVGRLLGLLRGDDGLLLLKSLEMLLLLVKTQQLGAHVHVVEERRLRLLSHIVLVSCESLEHRVLSGRVACSVR